MLPDVAEVLGNYFADCRRQYLSVFPADEWGAVKCEANAAVLFARVRACLKIGVLPDDAGFLLGMSEGGREDDHYGLLDLREYDVDCEDALDTVAALLAREGWTADAGAEEAAELIRRSLADAIVPGSAGDGVGVDATPAKCEDVDDDPDADPDPDPNPQDPDAP